MTAEAHAAQQASDDLATNAMHDLQAVLDEYAPTTGLTALIAVMARTLATFSFQARLEFVVHLPTNLLKLAASVAHETKDIQ
jgi:hypothetical protein